MDAPAAPELTEKTLSNGLPGVEIFFETLDEDVVTLTVWRIADGVREEVRGMQRVRVAGAYVETDWEVPFGVEATYVAETFDADGSSLLGEQASITVARDEVWFQNPVDPEMSFAVQLEGATDDYLRGDTADVIRRRRRTAKQFVFGKYRPFLQNFGLGGIEDLPVAVRTETREMYDRMRELLQESPILVRTPPVFRALPRLLSATIDSPEEQVVFQGEPDQWSVWLLQLDEVEPVSKAILRPLVTWADWEEAFPADDYDWDAVELMYAAGTWIDAVRNPPNA